MKPDEREAEYGKLTCDDLRARLKKVGAKRDGKKKELISRLIFYERNANFGYDEAEDEVEGERMKTPPTTAYKDLHAGCPMPNFQRDAVTSFLKKYQKRINEGELMYAEGYLLSVRFTMPDDTIYYLKGCCKYMMKKIVHYEIDASMNMEGEIQETSCECAAGNSVEAHCKHVIILLLAMADMCSRKEMIISQTCTQKLQKFHRPSKKYNESPQKAEDFVNKKRKSRKRTFEDDPNGNDQILKKAIVYENTEDYKIWYINHFRNVILNGCRNSSMPIKMIFPPENVYAVNLDHDYLSVSLETALLRELKLIDVTQEKIEEIEFETRGQASNPKWHSYRSVRAPASKFHKICHVTQKGAEKLVDSILHPKPIWSRPTMHGVRYEQTAVEAYRARSTSSQIDFEECGLFLSAQHPFICGTPDRLICSLTVLEVKCPYSSRNYAINEVTVPYLVRDEDGRLRLKKHHPYYYQVQGQMLVTNRLFCDFVVWTFVDMHHESIERDDEFIEDVMLPKLVKFYEEYLKPAILCKYLYRNTEKFH